MEQISVNINALRLHAFHGVMAQERVVGNEFEVTVRLDLATEALEAASADRLEATVNYAEAVEEIRRVMASPSKLLENVCWRIMLALRERFPIVTGGRIEVAKLTAPCGVEASSMSAVLTF